METHYTSPTTPHLNLTSLLSTHTDAPDSSTASIPKIAHFIYTSGAPIGWIEWLALRGAVVNWGAERVVIWLAKEVEATEGAMWKRVEAMEGVEVVRVALPEEVEGREVPEGERSGVGRLVVLWEMGGIFLENDLVALKSSDDVLLGENVTSTVLAKRLNPEGVPNWMIMSRPGSSVLRRWLESYQGEVDPETNERLWNSDSWKEMAYEVPTELALEKDPDLTVLDGHSWYYPLAAEVEGDVPLKKLWFGKSWDSVEESYGTHIWHWQQDMRDIITPEIVRTIDTPLFCRIRRLFDNLDGSGYIATAPKTNVNCSIASVPKLRSRHHRLFSDYRMTEDDSDAKWIDSSGFHLHGWAPRGAALRQGTHIQAYREFDEHSFAVLPVPSGWDTREWTVRMDLQLDSTALDGRDLIGLFKIRTENDGDVVVRVGHRKDPGYIVEMEWRDLGQAEANQNLRKAVEQGTAEIKSSQLKELGRSWHSLAITCDRREKGLLNVYLDGTPLGSTELQLHQEPHIGQEIWINAREWKQLDMGFRGSLRRFTVYADALTPGAIHQTIPNDAASLISLPKLDLHIQQMRLNESQHMLFFLLMILTMAIALSLVRSKRAVVREGLSYVREALRRSRG